MLPPQMRLSEAVFDPVPRVLDVGRHRRTKGGAVPLFQGGDHGFVVGDRSGPVFGLFVADIPNALEPRLKVRLHLLQRLVLGQRGQPRVELLIHLVIGHPVTGVIPIHHPVMQIDQGGDFFVVGAGAGQFTGQLLQMSQDLEH